jgi:hypothetical protein
LFIRTIVRFLEGADEVSMSESCEHKQSLPALQARYCRFIMGDE